MSAPVSVFDITVIADLICQSLTLHHIQTCRRVNKHWSSLFMPHLWSHLKLPATTTLSDDKITTLLKNKRWIRSITIAAQHIESISALGFTHFQELILYDQNFECSYEGATVSTDTIVSLLDNNPDLRSLEIDLNCDKSSLKRLPELRALKQKLEEVSLEQLMLECPLAFRKLRLPYEFEGCYFPVLKNCPDLQEVAVDLVGEQSGEVLEVQAGCPTLRGLDLRCGRHDMDYAWEVQRFTQLQTVSFPEMPKEMLQGVFDSLRRTSHETLEVLGLNISVSSDYVASVLMSFPNLKEIDLVTVRVVRKFPNLKVINSTTVRIYVEDDRRFPSGCYVPDAKDRTVDDSIVQDRDVSQLYRPDETMSEWWYQWTTAKRFMHAMSRAFMSEVEAFAYAEGRGVRANSMGQTLTVADAKRMVDSEHEEVEWRNEWQKKLRITNNRVDPVWEESRGIPGQ
ncbi:hypothetical protein BGZ92_003293 [Podila epicladia]|nr:hypothetical protein BGZ92_003293 [Podila epicladia]